MPASEISATRAASNTKLVEAYTPTAMTVDPKANPPRDRALSGSQAATTNRLNKLAQKSPSLAKLGPRANVLDPLPVRSAALNQPESSAAAQVATPQSRADESALAAAHEVQSAQAAAREVAPSPFETITKGLTTLADLTRESIATEHSLSSKIDRLRKERAELEPQFREGGAWVKSDEAYETHQMLGISIHELEEMLKEQKASRRRVGEENLERLAQGIKQLDLKSRRDLAQSSKGPSQLCNVDRAKLLVGLLTQNAPSDDKIIQDLAQGFGQQDVDIETIEYLGSQFLLLPPSVQSKLSELIRPHQDFLKTHLMTASLTALRQALQLDVDPPNPNLTEVSAIVDKARRMQQALHKLIGEPVPNDENFVALMAAELDRQYAISAADERLQLPVLILLFRTAHLNRATALLYPNDPSKQEFTKFPNPLSGAAKTAFFVNQEQKNAKLLRSAAKLAGTLAAARKRKQELEAERQAKLQNRVTPLEREATLRRMAATKDTMEKKRLAEAQAAQEKLERRMLFKEKMAQEQLAKEQVASQKPAEAPPVEKQD